MEHTLHLISGIPGTRVRKSLERICEYADRIDGRTVKVVSLEKELRKTAEPHVKKLYATEAFPKVTNLSTLLLPKELLREVWKQSFEKVQSLVEKEIRQADVLLTLHFTYFHHLTNEWLSPVDIQALSTYLMGKCKSIITLIDDIYDCYPALFVGGAGRFSAPRSHDQTIVDLLEILEWRSIEILVSNATADAAKLPHLLFAVKHPLRTFNDILFTSKPQLYISHPISEPRRLIQDGKIGLARTLVSKIEAAVARLRDRYVVIEPTTIDELRFTLNEDKQPQGTLNTRWPFLNTTDKIAEDKLYVPPPIPDPTSYTFAFPIGWEAEHRNSGVPNSHLTDRLFDAIKGQINGRDHHLTEQVNQIANYRPIFEGNPSKGVKEELDHLVRLIYSEYRSDKAIVFHPPEDNAAYAPRQIIEEVLPSWQKMRLVEGEPEAFEKLSKSLYSNGSSYIRRFLTLSAEQLIKELDAFGITVRPSDYHLPTNALGANNQVRRQVTAAQLAGHLNALNLTYLNKLSSENKIELETDEEKFFKKLLI